MRQLTRRLLARGHRRTTRQRQHDEAQPPFLMRVLSDDDALTPSIPENAVVLVDCSDQALVDGEIYAVRYDDELKLWLYRDGCAGVGTVVSNEAVATLSGLAGRFRFVGPIQANDLRVVGRVATQLNQGEPASAAGDANGESEMRETSPTTRDELEDLTGERMVLMTTIENLRAAYVAAVDDDAGTGGRRAGAAEPASAEEIDELLHAACNDEGEGERFRLEQQLDALTSRLWQVERRLADCRVANLEGVKAKLDILWDTQYAPFPEWHDDLEARLIATAREALDALCDPGSADQQRRRSETRLAGRIERRRSA